MWSLLTLPYLAFDDGIRNPVHWLQADAAQWERRGWRWQCSGREGGGGFVVVVRARQVLEVVPHTEGVDMCHLQYLFLCINERGVHEKKLIVPNLPGGFAKDRTNRKPE